MKCLQTSFIQQMIEGTLDPNRYGSFIVNDTYYSSRGPQRYATALLRSDGPAELRGFLKDDMKIYEAYNEGNFKKWHILPEAAQEFVDPSTTIKAYADELQTIAETQPLLHTLVAHAPCVMLWAWLGDRMLRDMTRPNAYERVVVETFASEKEQVDNLQRILDRVGEVKMDEWCRLDEVFRRSMEFELKNFVDAGERAEEKEALKRRLL